MILIVQLTIEFELLEHPKIFKLSFIDFYRKMRFLFSEGLSINESLHCYGNVIKTLVFEDNFDKLDFKTWKHKITMVEGGNLEF